MLKKLKCICIGIYLALSAHAQDKLTDFVNPFIGTTTLWDSVDLGYKPTRRAWGARLIPVLPCPTPWYR